MLPAYEVCKPKTKTATRETRLLQQLGYPLPIGLGLITLGTVLFWFHRRACATVLIAIGAGGLYLLATPAISGLLMGSLERGFEPAPADEYPQVDAIVVLGGGITPAVPPQQSANLLDAADRIRTGAHLYRAGRAPTVITTGARPYPDPGPSAAEAASELLQEFGVPANAIVAPGQSTTTREDALTVSALVQRRGIGEVLLVTSAFHMPRALATFEAVGIQARPAPTDYMSSDISAAGPLSWMPDYTAFPSSNKAWHEYAAIAYYSMRDWM